MSVSGARRPTPRDLRRRTHGQNFLVDQRVVRRFLSRADLRPDDLVVDLGAGTGALTLPLAAAGARVVAVERDPRWAQSLRRSVTAAGLAGRVEVVEADLRRVRLPPSPYRVVSSPPFSLTTAVLSRLLDDPEQGPWRADLLLQRAVAVKRAAEPPTSLRSAAWAPWWRFELGERVGRQAFRPVPGIDTAWLGIDKRDPPVLPTWLALGLAAALRPVWAPPNL
ncbi:23S rRNA (adenine(2058)-N(6))-methyltransferase Erm(37) [soil metagenome]